MRDPDARLAYWAERQFGVFSGGQALEVGFTRRMIRYRVERGIWVPVIGDTYRVAGSVEVWRQPVVGAYLVVGEPAAIAGPAALAMWEIGDPPATPELTVPWSRRPSRQDIVIHRTRRWNRTDMLRMGSVRVTSMARTLLDVAPGIDETKLETALDAAHRRGLDLRRLARWIDGAVEARVPGASLLRRLVDLRDPDRPIETEAETLVFGILRRAGLPLPVPQYPVRTRSGVKRLDFAYPDQRLAIEFDGYETHGSRAAFERDRARDNELADLGWDRRRITWTMATTDPAEVQWTVGRGLRLEPRSWGPPP